MNVKERDLWERLLAAYDEHRIESDKLGYTRFAAPSPERMAQSRKAWAAYKRFTIAEAAWKAEVEAAKNRAVDGLEFALS